MVGRRLDLWRLRNFDITRVDAPEDVLLYDCVARENPADRRLVALAQVRQMSVVRDEDGTITGLPHAERAVENCLEAIRRERVARGARRRQARHEPRLGHRLAGRRPRPRRARRARHQDQPADRRRRRRGGRGPGPSGRPRRRAAADGRALRRPAGIRRGLHASRSRRRTCWPPRRLRLEGGAVAPSRSRLPLRAERRAHRSRWHARRARPRRRPVSWCRSTGPTASTRPASSPPS